MPQFARPAEKHAVLFLDLVHLDRKPGQLTPLPSDSLNVNTCSGHRTIVSLAVSSAFIIVACMCGQLRCTPRKPVLVLKMTMPSPSRLARAGNLVLVGSKPSQHLPRSLGHLRRSRDVLGPSSACSFGGVDFNIVDIRSRRHRTLAGDVAQPLERKRPLEPQQQQADLHREGLVQERRINRPQRVFQRQPLLARTSMEDVLKLERLLDVEPLCGRRPPSRPTTGSRRARSGNRAGARTASLPRSGT